MGIILTIGIYASNEIGEYKSIKEYIAKLLKNYKSIIQMHGFYVDEEYKLISFDLIFSFDEEHSEEKVSEIKDKLKAEFKEYEFHIILDTDISD